MEPFQVLGNLYIPNIQSRYMTESNNPLRDLLSVTNVKAWAYRTPARTAQMAADTEDKLIKRWHQDGGYFNGVLLWSNEYQTEVRRLHGRKILAGEPGDVVLIDNYAVKHRTPSEFVQAVRSGETTNRHFIRCILNGYPSAEEIMRWKELLKGED